MLVLKSSTDFGRPSLVEMDPLQHAFQMDQNCIPFFYSINCSETKRENSWKMQDVFQSHSVTEHLPFV